MMAENDVACMPAVVAHAVRYLTKKDVDLIGGGDLPSLDCLDELREDGGYLLDLICRANNEHLVAAHHDHGVVKRALDAAQMAVGRAHEGRGVNSIGYREADAGGFHAPPG